MFTIRLHAQSCPFTSEFNFHNNFRRYAPFDGKTLMLRKFNKLLDIRLSEKIDYKSSHSYTLLTLYNKKDESSSYVAS